VVGCAGGGRAGAVRVGRRCRGQEVADLREVIRTNADRMLQGPGGDPQAAMTNLVGAVSRLAEDGGLPAPFREGVTRRRRTPVRAGSWTIVSSTELQAAYERLNGGRAFAVPDSAKDMDTILAWGQGAHRALAWQPWGQVATRRARGS